jgi:hypothetical protein
MCIQSFAGDIEITLSPQSHQIFKSYSRFRLKLSQNQKSMKPYYSTIRKGDYV